ncbi:MAG: NIPSNAP family protein, partial [Rhodanobacteraceae bacterium]
MNTETGSPAPRPADCAVVELRQYTLRPRARETLIRLFEREFVESQEACGASVIGTFRDLDQPDRFVWLRGFADMRARRQALAEFYGGLVWKAHRDAANAT